MKNRFLLFVLPFLASCGPGLIVDPPPNVFITSPSDGSTVTTLKQVYTGTCENGLPISISYGDGDITGPSTTTCTNGNFSFPVTLQAVEGTHGATVSQTDANGHTGEWYAGLAFSRLPLNQANGFDGTVNAVYVDSSNNVYAGGAFTTFAGTAAPYFAKLSSGSLVSGFALATAFNGAVNAIMPAPDSTGDLYVGGAFEGGIARITNAGAASTTFINAGFTGGSVNAIVAAPGSSGDIYLGGTFTAYGAQSAVYGIARVSALGVITTTAGSFFANAGTAFQGGTVSAIAQAPDNSGDIYVGGAFAAYDTSNVVGNIVRITSSGTVNPAFAVIGAGKGFSGGSVTTILPTQDDSGDIFVGGDFTQFNGTNVPNVVRLTSTGTLSTNFASSADYSAGAVIDKIFYSDSTYTKIYVLGGFSSYGTTSVQNIARILTNGSIDPNFAPGTGFDANYEVVAGATDSSGDIFVGGTFVQFDGYGVNRMAHLTTTGTIDTSMFTGAGFNGAVRAILPINDGTGDIYVGGGFTYYDGTPALGLVRLQMDGTLSNVLTTDSDATGFVGGDVYALTAATDGSGDIFVGGDFTSYAGTSLNRFVRISSVGAITLQPLSAGFDGIVRVILPVPGSTNEIYVAGNFANYHSVAAPGIVRLTSTATADGGFSTAGGGFLNGAAAGEVDGLLPATDGSGDIIAVGQFSKYNGAAASGIVRITSNGTANATFASNAGSGFGGGFAQTAIAATDGTTDFYVGGQFTTFNGGSNSYPHLIRLTNTGTISSAFPIGTGFDSTVFALLPVAASTDLYVGGLFSFFDGSTAKKLARITASTTINSSAFNVGTGPDNEVLQIVGATDGSGDLYIGGLFSNFNTTATDTLARVDTSGSLD